MAAILGMACTIMACGTTDPADNDPNVLAGETELEITEPGQRWGGSGSSGSWYSGESLRDSVIVKSRSGGIVTFDFNLTFDTTFTKSLDTMLGTSILPETTKKSILTTYLERYGATLDTTDKSRMKIHAEPRFKVTSDGIQDFLTSGDNLSRPFTIIKYSMKVGDSWTFTRDDGVVVSRKVIHHSSVEDYDVGFWSLKVFKTEQTQQDPLVPRIVWVTNHKFGLVGVHFFTVDNREIRVTVWPPTL